MNRGTIALTALGFGAAVMYLADPRDGRRRRARLRDTVAHASHVVEETASAASRDVRNRAGGIAARTLAALVPHTTPIDDVIVARVRSRLGRLVAHPGAIEVGAKAGVVTLRGPVFATEVPQLLRGVLEVPDIVAVENHLDAHEQAGDIPALQGPGPMAQPSWMRWTPAARLLAGAAGVALMTVAARGRMPRAAAAGVAGFELLERALLGAGPAAHYR